jgi:hypothetical protein
MDTLSEWYDQGFDTIWDHLTSWPRLTAQGKKHLRDALAYCRARYIVELVNEVGHDTAFRVQCAHPNFLGDGRDLKGFPGPAGILGRF